MKGGPFKPEVPIPTLPLPAPAKQVVLALALIFSVGVPFCPGSKFTKGVGRERGEGLRCRLLLLPPDIKRSFGEMGELRSSDDPCPFKPFSPIAVGHPFPFGRDDRAIQQKGYFPFEDIQSEACHQKVAIVLAKNEEKESVLVAWPPRRGGCVVYLCLACATSRA
ncbi:hypothetical protein JTE90_016965 [Oedothorax gibbosus]|uniref:Uncharacterized protein n=1 Tax=Oedothorax gibbosus TaxID=931172 RepID=A0AAV6UFC9_9ARAC|nr:hypothetical protein JTE90_016965 [Oedothorax gibbosus]